MTIANSPFPKTLCGFEVMLVETDKKSLVHHAYVLIQNSFRVTTTTKILEALSMVVNKRTFDCVLVDAENRDMDLVAFLHRIWSVQPKMRIVVLTSSEFHIQLGSENLANDVIWFLRKPIGAISICNALQQVCISGLLALREGTSTGKSLEENQNCKIVQKVGTMFPPSIFNNIMINNSTSSSNGTHQGLNINKQKYGAMCKPVAFLDISGDDDADHEATINKSICTGTAESKDRGKKPMELKRKNEPPAELDINRQKRKNINSHAVWTPVLPLTPALCGNFLEAFTSFGKEGAHPKAIQNPMNMPDHACAQVASPLQKIQGREKFSKKPRVVLGPMKKNIDLQIESYKRKRSGLSTSFDNNASMKNRNSVKRSFNHNYDGTSFVIYEKVMARGGPQLPLPQQTTTTINNSAGDQAIKPFSGDQIQPPIGETSMSSGFVLTGNSRSGGIAVNEGLAPLTVGGGREASLNVGLDDVAFPKFISGELGDVCHRKKFQGNGETLFDVENSDTDNFGPAGTSFSPPSISGFENNSEAPIQPSGNSIVPLLGSDGRIIDNDWYLKLIHG